MRKHFLILMLMALLPMAGWAEIAWDVAPLAANDLAYTGSAQPLFSNYASIDATAAGDVTWAVKTTDAVPADLDYSDDEPKGTGAGTYYVWAKQGENTQTWTIVIAKKENSCTTQPGDVANVTYGTAITEPSAAVFSAGGAGTIKYAAAADAEADDWSVTPPSTYNTADNEGKWYYKAVYAETANVKGAESAVKNFKINKAALSVSAKAVTMTYGDAFADFYTITAGAAKDKFETDFAGDAVKIIPVTYQVASLNAGARNFTITGKSYDNFTVNVAEASATALLTVNKKALTITANPINISYGDTPVYTYTYGGGGFAPGETSAVLTINTPKLQKAGVDYTTTPIEAGTYTIIPQITAQNYALTIANGTLTVDGKDLADESITLATPANGQYTGVELIREPQVTDAIDEETTINVNKEQFNVHYMYSKTAEGPFADLAGENDKILNAGYYKMVITPSANSNYAGTKTSAAFQIAKVELMVMADSETIFYGKEPAKHLTYDGFVNGENETNLAAKAATLTDPTYWTAPTFTIVAQGTPASTTDANANPYTVKAEGGQSLNYMFVPVNGTLKINKAKVKIVASNNTNAYGQSKTSWTPTKTTPLFTLFAESGVDPVTGEILYETAVADATTVLDLIGGTGADKNNFKNLSITCANDGSVNTNPGYEINVTGNGSFTKNYQEGTRVKGKYTITKGTATITMNNISKVYASADPTGWAETYEVNGIPTADKAAVRNVVEVTRAEGEDAGSYVVTIAVDDEAEFANFDVVVDPTPVRFFIQRAPLTITADDQTLYIGMTESDLNQDAIHFATMLNNETLAYELVFGAGVTTIVNTDEEKELTTEEVQADGVFIKLANTEENNAIAKNYNITYHHGTLTVVNVASNLVLNAAADNSLAIAQAAAIAGTKTVTVTGRTLAADKWNVLVLPFQVNTLEFCNNIGEYAVFNVLQSAVGSDVKFGLEFTAIPANVPFLVKTKNAVNLASHPFAGVTVVNGDAGIEVGTATLVGTYDQIYPLAVQEGMYTPQGGKFKPYTSESTYAFPATMAYLLVNATGEARITVEELDGSTTSISEISANGVAMSADGWYTVNGVKLQGAPAEKGIYINNGKKVVIK